MAAICRDPLVLLLEMASGTLVDVDISVNIRYGYDIRGEVVAENGTAALGESSPVRVRRDGLASDRVPADWRERFSLAYDVELRGWVGAVTTGGPLGPSAWEGFAAALVSDAALEAMHTGSRTPLQLPPRAPACTAPEHQGQARTAATSTEAPVLLDSSQATAT